MTIKFTCLVLFTFSGWVIASELTTPVNQEPQNLHWEKIELLLQDAQDIYRSPARISTPGMARKLPANMKLVVEKLQQAFKLAPWRADLLFSQASAYIHLNKVDKALAIYRQILLIAPQDIDALTYITAWAHMQGNLTVANECLSQLQTLSPERATLLKRMLTVIDHLVTSPLQDTISVNPQPAEKTAIVVPGYALETDGTMNIVLIQRLEKTLQLANQFPEAILIVTGGVQKNNQTEAQVMARWLNNHGIDNNRIFQDNFAKTTVENALFSRYILAQQGIKQAFIVSSPGHVRRSTALFTLASEQTGPQGIKYTGIAASEKKLRSTKITGKKEEKIFLYRDALKAIGLWSFRSAPLEEL